MMTNYFVDTSALGKRYIPEIGALWMQSEMHLDHKNVIMISELTTVEFCPAVARQRADKQLSDDDAFQMRANFLSHANDEYLVVPINSQVITLARTLVERHERLRTLDAIQLASAKIGLVTLAQPLVFVSSDQRLLDFATSEGFVVDNPLLHV